MRGTLSFCALILGDDGGGIAGEVRSKREWARRTRSGEDRRKETERERDESSFAVLCVCLRKSEGSLFIYCFVRPPFLSVYEKGNKVIVVVFFFFFISLLLFLARAGIWLRGPGYLYRSIYLNAKEGGPISSGMKTISDKKTNWHFFFATPRKTRVVFCRTSLRVITQLANESNHNVSGAHSSDK